MSSKGFIKSSFIYTFVGALPYASGFLLLPWFTQYLTPAQFGINALYISLMYLMQIFATFGFDMSAGVMYYDYRDNAARLRKYLGTVFVLLFICGILSLLFFSFGGFWVLTKILGSEGFIELLPYGLITIVSAMFNSVFKTYSNLLIYQQRPMRFLWINISNFIITIAGSLILLYLFPQTLYGPIFGRLIPAVVSAGISLVFIAKESELKLHVEFVKKIISFTSPLFIYALLTWVISYIDRFIIMGFIKDPVLVGIFDFAVKLVLFLDLIMTGLVNTINPKVYSIWQRDNLKRSTPEVNRYYSGLTAFFLVLVPLFVLVAPMLIPIVIHKAIYFQAFRYIAILSAGYMTRVWFFMYLAPIMFFKKTKVLPRVFLFSAIFEVGTGMLMVSYFGLQGAVWTFFLVKPFQAFLLYLDSRKVFEFSFNRFKIIWLPVIFIAVVITSEMLTPSSYRFIVECGQLVVALFLVWFTYRKEIIPLIRERLAR
jgi:O-antigen/teichoic acid export membrane protein